MAEFEPAFDFCGPHEYNAYRHYSNWASDPGGSTNWGITQRTLDSVIQRYPGFPADVKDLTLDQAKAIYRGEYWPTWAPLNSQQLASKCFDIAVNLGVGTAIRYLQDAVGVPVDGHFGPVTLQAVQTTPPASALSVLCSHLVAHYKAWVAEDASRNDYLDGLLARAQALPHGDTA